jgi:uroporphyrinogen III methyltransferase/synthase
VTTLARRTLAGRRILVTRPRRRSEAVEANDALVAALQGLGAEVLWLPGLEIGPPDDWGPLDRAIRLLPSFDWAVFTSQNGVDGFASRLLELGQAWRGPPRAAAVGRRTAEALVRFGQTDVRIAPRPLASSLAESLASGCAGQRFLWPRAQVAPDLLAQRLLRAGAAEVVAVPAYSARVAEADAGPVRKALADGSLDGVTFTSARSVEATLEALGTSGKKCLSLIPRVCIGPVTAEACLALGLGASMVADGSLEGLVRLLIDELGS